jgi:hypothetical protein
MNTFGVAVDIEGNKDGANIQGSTGASVEEFDDY